jgi:hypothetical protein
MYDEWNKLITRLSGICLALAGVVEKKARGECIFRLAGDIWP